jgi:hypothetical protein
LAAFCFLEKPPGFVRVFDAMNFGGAPSISVEPSVHSLRISIHSGPSTANCAYSAPGGENTMDNLTGLVAVTMLLGMPTAAFAMYTFYRVRKLRSQERMAAIARGITVPMAPDLTEAARSRRSGILLVAGAIGYMITFTLIARVEPDAWIAASFGAIPLTVGLGFFLDSALIRRDLRAS